ncbi:1-deoxy-D-xylulose-5-phosphate synthase [Rubeoparvulum massiliense]|uniref:1-deoxy-D-xylulose-5-phosphate synthase n=1 Tax=Rubeoparvulum massiliense TaxID=1631346 RepID=UPI00065E3FDE|nr:1-deoxy-D-xylulose-5-phosphate synthase [Rubeoparvulum massiliense]
MYLERIHTPDDVKKLNVDELKVLAHEIRDFLIVKLSKTGGHLAPNLGVVELTLAMHYVFQSPKDKLIWDVGHQSYVHKILTGRQDQFDTLRQFHGLSGFPKRRESIHDVWEAGHSSTSLSAAMGMAIARDCKGEKYHIVPVIGDGAMTGGMAFEALNHIGHDKKNMIVILNDNEMSIAPNVGALHQYLNKLRTGKPYNKVKKEVINLIGNIPAIGDSIYNTLDKLKDSLKYLVVDGVLFEELGYTYLGPIDGHSLEDLIDTLEHAKEIEGPTLIHVITKKGKGYKPAEDDAYTFHGSGPYKIESGEIIKKEGPPSYSKVFGDTLMQLAKHDNRIIAITPAMTDGSGLKGFAAKYPDRFFDVGIAEQHAVTMAGGIATQGLKPVCAIYSTFLQRAYDQVIHDITRQNLNVVFAIDRAGLVGADGETHHGVFDIAFLRILPNLVVMMPKDENELRNMLYTAIQYNDGPIAVRYPRGGGRGVPYDHEFKQIPIGTFEVLRAGHDLAILTMGNMLPLAEQAADRLAEQGISARIINARFIKPLDEAMLMQLADEQLPIITVEEGVLAGGFGSAVREFYSEHHRCMEIETFGIPDQFIEHGSVELLREEIGLTPEKIVEAATQLTSRKRMQQ